LSPEDLGRRAPYDYRVPNLGDPAHIGGACMDSSRNFGVQLDSLLAMSAEIASLRELPEVYSQALNYCLELTGSKFGFIGLLDDEGREMVVAAVEGFAPTVPGFYEEFRFMSVRSSVFGITLIEERPYISNDVAHDPLSVGIPPGHPLVERFLGVPLKIGSTMIGMLGVANKPGGYGRDEERLLSTFANQVAVAIDNARLYEQQRDMINKLVSVVDLATSESTVRSRRSRTDTQPSRLDSEPALGLPLDRASTHGLTNGQSEILRLIAEGFSNREIAAQVHLSENTVKTHVQEIFRKLDARNRVDAAIKAAKNGLI
jgi:GAF domain-containing protein